LFYKTKKYFHIKKKQYRLPCSLFALLCTYVHMYVGMYICMYLCVLVCMYICMHGRSKVGKIVSK
jgi:hypothetical protein